MSLVTYEIPNLDNLKNEHDKPQPLAGKSFPYNDLDHRRFEELLYSIYRPKLNSTEFPFDNISLMSGVRDQGRDCALRKNDSNTGLIQCKKYASPLNKQQFAEEITKYVLYSIIDEELLPDTDDFHYYIAVSSGFSLECSNFIDDFNRLAPVDADLYKWVAKNIKNPTLASLEIQNVNPLVSEIFSKIKVRKIIPQDLDSILFESACKSLIPLFFNVLTVVDNSEIIKLQEQLSSILDPKFDLQRIQNELQKGSSSLKIEKNEFDDIPDSHIEREETRLLHDWITQPAQIDQSDRQLNICMLAGNAGKGKTVILKDLYDTITLQGIPVLGLKADKLQSSNLLDLQHKIGLSLPVVQFIDLCKIKYQKVVILIDQIDALSQSMSSDRNYLEVFRSLVEKFTYDPNVRIIISVRIFDLHYDPAFRAYRNIKTITVAPLNDDLILQQLDKLGIQRSQVNAKLLSLLRTPNHLNIFSRIAKSKGNILSVNSLQDLYTELWSIKVTDIPHKHPVTAKKVKKLLYKIAESMFKFQRITIIAAQFEEYAKELRYLESERLIKREENYIQFFHQTFYDFTFSKRFVEKGSELIDYIKNQEQSILIRSAVKMIFHYLRDYNPDLYHQTLRELFDDPEIMHHVRHMVFCWLVFIENPSDQEADMVMKVASENMEFNILFLQHARSEDWLRIAIESNLLDFLNAENTQGQNGLEPELHADRNRDDQLDRRRSCELFLASYTAVEDSIVWRFLEGLKDEKFISGILYYIDNWTNPIALKLMERCEYLYDTHSEEYMTILHRIAEFDPCYCLEKIQKSLLSGNYFDEQIDISYQGQAILKLLSEKIPEQMIPKLQNTLKDHLKTSDKHDTEIYSTVYLYDVDFDNEDTLQGMEICYRILAVCLRNCAGEKNEVLMDFIQVHKTSTFEPVLRLIIYAAAGKEEKYKDTIFDLFKHVNTHSLFITSCDFGIEFREVFEKAFPYFDSLQKNTVISTIKDIRLKKEIRIYNDGTKKYKHLFVGYCQYLLLERIPKTEIDTDPILLKKYLELQRKFGTVTEKRYSGNLISSGIFPPISEERFAKMSHKNWIGSFKKYHKNAERSGNDSLKGGIYDHSRAFRDFCKTEPYALKIEIIKSALDDSKIDTDYPLMGLMGLSESSCEPKIILPLFRQIMPETETEYYKDYAVQTAAALLKKGTYDTATLQFIVDAALDFKSIKTFTADPAKGTSFDGIALKGRNNTFGTAISGLIHADRGELESIVFETLEKILEDGPDEAKACILYRFAYLNSLNKERAYALFNASLTREENIYVAASSIWSLQYMVSVNFTDLKPVFLKLIQAPELGVQDSQWLFSILYFSYLFNRPEAELLLHSFLRINGHSRAYAVRQISKHYYHDENSKQKSQLLLMYLLDVFQAEDKISFNYSQMDHIKLNDIFEFLQAFIEKDNFELSDGMVSYLTLQCNGYPFQSVELFNKALQKQTNKIRIQTFLRRTDGLTKFVAVAFNAIKDNDSRSKQTRKLLLESFSLMLKDYRYRNISEKILEELS
ncbi:ATPase family associated with various cellular activities (AAA) [Flavobacterium sp. CF108]|uniref:NACHT domain-containing protein n=1 Tax=Flavobacterium sp. CF108 TaxID=1882758 RepID=UPI0009138518|nr:AAA family ATPase [Flavobacterium sp. CF108]SHH92423.1 ATPase family associated with various cellular activities (AAA) [Flavobacterium sp. CF108]